jgi:hypothetical protein
MACSPAAYPFGCFANNHFVLLAAKESLRLYKIICRRSEVRVHKNTVGLILQRAFQPPRTAPFLLFTSVLEAASIPYQAQALTESPMERVFSLLSVNTANDRADRSAGAVTGGRLARLVPKAEVSWARVWLRSAELSPLEPLMSSR